MRKSTIDYSKLPEALQIVDFGAGTYAMLFAATLHAADLTKTGRGGAAYNLIYVHNIEPSKAMQSVGELTYQSFCNRVRQLISARSEHSPLRVAVDSIRYSSHVIQDMKSPLAKRKGNATNRILSALHVVYDDENKQEDMRRSLNTLYQQLQPTSGIITAHKGKAPIAHAVSPFPSLNQNVDSKMIIQDTTDMSVLDDVCRKIGFVRYPDQPYHKQVYPTSKDSTTLFWK